MHDKIVSRSRFRLENTLATRQHTGLTIVSETRMSPLPNSLRVPLSVYHCPWITGSFGSPILVDECVCWVESTAPEEVSHLDCVNQPVPPVPEVEQIEHLLHVCNEQ